MKPARTPTDRVEPTDPLSPIPGLHPPVPQQSQTAARDALHQLAEELGRLVARHLGGHRRGYGLVGLLVGALVIALIVILLHRGTR